MHVYVIRSEDEVHKIGIASDPKQRMRGLQTASAYRLSLVYYRRHVGSLAVEQRAHLILSEKRMMGEWFAVAGEEAVKTVHEAVRQLNVERDATLRQDAQSAHAPRARSK